MGSTFATRVNAIARARGGRTGKVPIVTVWFEMGEPHWNDFQASLLRALREGEIDLVRADLRGGDNADDIEDSTIVHPVTGAEYNYVVAPRKNPAPKDVEPAAELYEGFHQYDVDEVVPFDPRMTMPRFATQAGKALHVLYRSSKIDPETGHPPRGGAQDYIHEHDAGVHIYEPAEGDCDDPIETPKMLLEIDTLVYLGQCLGVAFRDEEGEEFEIDWSRGVDLFAIPSGKALVIVRAKREILCLVWGGGLGVEPRGIVG